MDISDKSLYNSQLYKLNKNIALSQQDLESKDQIIDHFLADTLRTRKPHEIVSLQQRLKEKSLLIEKSKASLIIRKKKKSKKTKQINCKRIKGLNLHLITKNNCKYSNFFKLHELWLSYMKSVFGDQNGNITKLVMDERLLKIDYHGCMMEVYNSKCKNLIGIHGVVAKESKHMVTLITDADEMKVIPKKNTIFSFLLDGYQIKINGDAIIGRPGYRVVKKWKGNYKNAEMFIK